MSRPLQLESNQNRDLYNFLVVLNDSEQTLAVLSLESTDGSVSGTDYVDSNGNSTNNNIKYFVTKKGITTGYQNLNFDYVCQFSSVNSYNLSSFVFDNNIYDLTFLPNSIKEIYDLNSGITTNQTITFDSPNIPSIPTTIVKIPGDCVTNCEIIETLPYKIKEQICASSKFWKILLEINPENLIVDVTFKFELSKSNTIRCIVTDEKTMNFTLKTKYKNGRIHNIIGEAIKSSEDEFLIDGCSNDINNAEIFGAIIGKFDVFNNFGIEATGQVQPKFGEVPTIYEMESRFRDDPIAVAITQTVAIGTTTLLEYGRYVNCNEGIQFENYSFEGQIAFSVDQDTIYNNIIKYIGGWATTTYNNFGILTQRIPKFSSEKRSQDAYGSKTFESKALRGIRDVLKKIPAEVNRFCDIPPCSISERYKYAKHLLDSKLVQGGILRTLINQLFKDMMDAMDHKECPCPD